MTSPVVSGIIENILQDLDDDGTLYPSGKVQQKIFSCLPGLNGLLGTSYSGSNIGGTISPEISGLSHQRILEVYVSQELLRKEMLQKSRVFNITSFSEGDSKVTASSNVSDLIELYKRTAEELKHLVRQSKYTDVSKAATSVQGEDRNIPIYGPTLQDP